MDKDHEIFVHSIMMIILPARASIHSDNMTVHFLEGVESYMHTYVNSCCGFQRVNSPTNCE